MKTLEKLGRKQTASTKKKIAKAMTGEKNPAYKSGQRSYRNKTNAKLGQIVHHVDGNRSNNDKSNLKVISKKDRGKHDKAHNRGANFQKSGGTKKRSHTKKSNPKRIK